MKRLLVVITLLSAACGSPTAPSPSSVAGTWTGNMQSSNWNAIAVSVVLAQSAASVSGTWANASNDWNGTITGTTDPTSFTGTFTISTPNASGVGPRCTGTASVSGPASSGGQTVRWTGAGFTGSCTGLPVSLVWNLQR